MKSAVICGSKRHKDANFALTPLTGDPCRDAIIDKVITAPKQLAALL